MRVTFLGISIFSRIHELHWWDERLLHVALPLNANEPTVL